MRFLHEVDAALRFPRRAGFVHFDDASWKPAPQLTAHGREMIPRILQPGFHGAQVHQLKETQMFNSKIKLATAAIAVAATGTFATPAMAGQCATPGVNALANAPT